MLPPACDAPKWAPSAQSELPTWADPTEDKRHLRNAGRLEDFLGSEPGELATLMDDLHGQMLCTPGILDPPPSPLDTFGATLEELGLRGMDWFDLTSGEEEPLSPGLLGPPTPSSVFSTDFLDSPDLAIHWDL